jgi:hypothetical protein
MPSSGLLVPVPAPIPIPIPVVFIPISASCRILQTPRSSVSPPWPPIPDCGNVPESNEPGSDDRNDCDVGNWRGNVPGVTTGALALVTLLAAVTTLAEITAVPPGAVVVVGVEEAVNE